MFTDTSSTYLNPHLKLDIANEFPRVIVESCPNEIYCVVDGLLEIRSIHEDIVKSDFVIMENVVINNEPTNDKSPEKSDEPVPGRSKDYYTSNQYNNQQVDITLNNIYQLNNDKGSSVDDSDKDTTDTKSDPDYDTADTKNDSDYDMDQKKNREERR